MGTPTHKAAPSAGDSEQEEGAGERDLGAPPGEGARGETDLGAPRREWQSCGATVSPRNYKV